MVFGLPVGARDAMLRVGPAAAAPSSDVGKLYHYNQLEDGAQQSGMQLAGGMKALAAVQQLDKFSKRLYGKQTSSSAAKGAAAGIWDEFVPAESSSSAPLPRGPVPFRNLPKVPPPTQPNPTLPTLPDPPSRATPRRPSPTAVLLLGGGHLLPCDPRRLPVPTLLRTRRLRLS